MTAAAPTAETAKGNGQKEEIGAQRQQAAAALKAEPKPKPRPRQKQTEFDVSHIEYIVLTPALDTSAKGTVRKDRSGGRTAGAARTDRFTNSRMYRTGSDRVTIQTAQGEEIVLRLSVFERMLARAKELSVTKEIPNFR